METDRKIRETNINKETNSTNIAEEICTLSEEREAIFNENLNHIKMCFQNDQLENAFFYYFDKTCHKNHYHLIKIFLIEVLNAILSLIYFGVNKNEVPTHIFILFGIFKALSFILELLTIFHHKSNFLNAISNYTLFLAVTLGDFPLIYADIHYHLSFLEGLNALISVGSGMQFYLAMYSRSKNFISTLVAFWISFLFFTLTLNADMFKVANYKLIKIGGCLALTLFGSIYIYTRNKEKRKEFFDLYNLAEELRNQKEIQENLPIPLIIANKEQISYCNQHTKSLLSIPPEANPENIIKGIHYCSNGKKEQFPLISFIKKQVGKPKKMTMNLLIESSTLLVEAVKFPFRYKDQVHNFVILKDMTDALQMEKERMQKGYELLIIGAITHNFRTPLNCILGTSELALQTYLDMPEQLKKGLERINNQSNILFDYVDTIHEYFYFKNNKLKLNDSKFDPREVLKSVLKLYQEEINEKKLEISIIVPQIDSLIFINDMSKYRQIIGALLANSIKFTHQGKITIELEYNFHTNVLHTFIEDTGIGIASTKLENIIKGLSKIDSQDFNDKENIGLGFGIPLSNGFCQIMGGDKLEIDSKERIGTTIQFNIPNHFDPFDNENDIDSSLECSEVFDEPIIGVFHNSLEELKSSNFLSAKRQKILIVDDAESNIYILKQYAEREGLEYECAHNGEESLNIYMQSFNEESLYRFFIVFMDINMPIMDGIEATRKIREFEKQVTAKVPIIGITANFEASIKKECKMAGMASVRLKPFSHASFKKIISLCTSIRSIN